MYKEGKRELERERETESNRESERDREDREIQDWDGEGHCRKSEY